MKNFSERLRFALYKRGISQSEAARRCSISQQAINYIIRSNIDSSKLAIQIAHGLNLNPEWLIYGKGKFESTELLEIPVIKNKVTLDAFINGIEIKDQVDILFLDKNYGKLTFAFSVSENKLAICGLPDLKNIKIFKSEYLIFTKNSFKIENNNRGNAYQIYEWRILNFNF